MYTNKVVVEPINNLLRCPNFVVSCLFIQGVLIRGVPAVLFIEVSSFQGVLIRGVLAVLFIEVSSFQGVLIRGVPVLLSNFHGMQGFIQDFWVRGGGRSLWGTATASCMSMRLYKFSSFLVGRWGFQGPQPSV